MNERKCYLLFIKCVFSDPTGSGKRINNSRTFEKYRKEFKQTISNITSNFKGDLNSQFGKHWFTNRDTGECKSFSEKPNEKWILGRNLFKGECSILVEIKKKLQYEQTTKNIQNLWNLFHSKKFNSLTEFVNSEYVNCTLINLVIQFKKYIPSYNKLVKHGCYFKSDKNLINKFE